VPATGWSGAPRRSRLTRLTGRSPVLLSEDDHALSRPSGPTSASTRSTAASSVVQTNLVIAGIVVVGLVGWDLLGDLSLVVGVAGHETATVIVGLDGLRLLRREVRTDG
jgi:hypothetical protein